MAFLILTEQETLLPVYSKSVGHWDHQEKTVRKEGYPSFQWLFCSSGSGVLRVREEEIPVLPGTGMFLYPHEPHEYEGIEPWEVDWITLYGPQVEPLAKLAGLTRSGVYKVQQPAPLLAHLRSAQAIALSNRPLIGLECSKAAYSLLLDMTRYLSWGSTGSHESGSERLQPVFDYMETHYPLPVTLEELAEVIGVSAKHFCLIFRRTVKMRPMEYLNLLRIRKSKEIMLQERNLPLKEIAGMVGFETPGYFSLLFKKAEGMTPDLFRRLNRLS
ncbi:AraC family transcriptional regulator [Gorillibacterium timonense]|uniref:AraC family transcriptional regulator n=1 Tax=Gorillibacterium timonense TaxID=1689269 RepID=UPI001F29FE8A|nr:AraC family transcriptional regulator [Gorillibacterium timonense]